MEIEIIEEELAQPTIWPDEVILGDAPIRTPTPEVIVVNDEMPVQATEYVVLGETEPVIYHEQVTITELPMTGFQEYQDASVPFCSNPLLLVVVGSILITAILRLGSNKR